jgi:hypothetical protein
MYIEICIYTYIYLCVYLYIYLYIYIGVNCGEWLHCLPDECLPPKTMWGTDELTHPIFNDDEISFLNIDMCIVSLQRVQLPCQRKLSYHEYNQSNPFNSPPPKTMRMEPLMDGLSGQTRLTPTSTADLEL